jgi:hypothetical protein
MLKNVIRKNVAKIREINQKYAVSRVRMSTGVKYSLLMLRIYLLFLVALLVYKFITIVI